MATPFVTARADGWGRHEPGQRISQLGREHVRRGTVGVPPILNPLNLSGTYDVAIEQPINQRLLRLHRVAAEPEPRRSALGQHLAEQS